MEQGRSTPLRLSSKSNKLIPRDISESLGKLPPQARPDLSVEGVIDIERKRDAVYVDRPSFAQSFSKTTLYRLDPDGDRANRVSVQFGRASTRFIEVINGLKPGDRVIVSDPSAWESHDTILIK